MKIELELWHLITLFTMFCTACFAFGKILLGQFEKRLDERFSLRDENLAKSEKEWSERFVVLDQGQRQMERDFLGFQARLPETYVRREDYIRGQTVIEAKLDALASGQSEMRTLIAAHDRT